MVKVVCIEITNILVKTITFYALPEKSRFLTICGNGLGHFGTLDVDWNNAPNQILYYNHSPVQIWRVLLWASRCTQNLCVLLEYKVSTPRIWELPQWKILFHHWLRKWQINNVTSDVTEIETSTNHTLLYAKFYRIIEFTFILKKNDILPKTNELVGRWPATSEFN